MLNVSESLVARKSVRAFLDKSVDADLIKQILGSARHAPSGTNTQPWQVAVVSGMTKQQLDEKLIAAFRSNIPKELDYKYYPESVTLEMKRRLLECGLQMYQTLAIERGDTGKRLLQWEKNYSAFGAPVVMYIFMPKIIEKGSFLDCGMFIQSISLMATSLGLATCVQAALAEYPNIVREQLQYTNDMLLVCGIALGYEDKAAVVNNYRTPREELDKFVRFFA